MSQHMHAPGPWIARHEPDDCGEFAIQAANGIHVALTIGSTRSEAANALVIAAAPDMLAVLQELQESASYWSEYDVPLGIVDRINAAIAKATSLSA